MKNIWTTLSVALAVSLLAVEAQAGGNGRKPQFAGSAGRTSFSTGRSFQQGNSTLNASGQFLVKHNGPNGFANLGPLNAATRLRTAAVNPPAGNLNLSPVVAKNLAGTLKFKTSAANPPPGMLNLNQITTPVMKNPWTGQDLSQNANPGSGLPGGMDLGKAFPSGQQQWNDRVSGALGGGSDYLGQGTPFGSTPGSDPANDFLNQHGGSIPDPLAAAGKDSSGVSPVDDDQTQNDQNQNGQTQNDQNQNDQNQNDNEKGSVTVGEIKLLSMLCGSDIIGKENIGKDGDECIIVEYGNNDNFNVTMANNFLRDWLPKGTHDSQEDGEGGCGGGYTTHDLNIGSIGRMTGKAGGDRDPGQPGLGQDTGRKMPARIEAIGKYVAQGGKVLGKAGYQGSDSGHGQDMGGLAEGKISDMEKAIDAQRFIVDPNAKDPEQAPWWIQKVVSPKAQQTTTANTK